MQPALIANQVEYAPTPAGPRWVLGAIRIVLLLFAASAVAAGVLLDPGHDVEKRGDASATRFVCPMHPEVIAGAPGPCPICRMALEPVAAPAGATHDAPHAVDPRAYENLRRHDIFDVARVRSLPAQSSAWRGAAWVEDDGSISGIFYGDQIAALVANESGTFIPAAAPKTRTTVRWAADARPAAWDRSTSRLRFELDRSAPAPRYETGLVGWVELEPRPREVLTVPASAILRSPEGPYVLLAGEGLTFEKRSIEVGEVNEVGEAGERAKGPGLAAVLSGLRASDRVVARAAFFLDAERQMGAMTEMREVAR